MIHDIMKILHHHVLSKRRVLAVALVIAAFLLLLSTDQISDKEKMRKLLCTMYGDERKGVDDINPGMNDLQASVDRINDEISLLSAEHTGLFEQRLPQAIVMGVRKCGTRALIEMLRLHPSIAAAKPELHFFDDYYEKGLTWYKKQMPFSYADQITMEKTPAYFITNEAPDRIYRMNSSIKLLAIVRDPTVRTISDYTQIMSHTANKNRDDFPKFEDKVLVNGEIDTTYQAIKTSMYANYVKNWYNYFPKSQIMFVDGAKLIVDPFPEMKRVEQFLGLKGYFNERVFVYNETKGFYCLKKKKLKCLGSSKGQSHPDVKAEVIRKLQDFFRPYNKKFFELTGTNFDWE